MDARADMVTDVPPDASIDALTDSRVDVVRDVAADAPAERPADVAVETSILDLCPPPRRTITAPGPLFSIDGTTAGMSGVSGASCEPLASGPEDVYTLNVTSRSVVNLDTEGERTTFNTTLSVRRVCNDGATEIACDGGTGGTVRSRIQTLLEPGAYAVIVDGCGGGAGPYTLALTATARRSASRTRPATTPRRSRTTSRPSSTSRPPTA